MDEMFYFFLLFSNALDLNNQKNLWLPSIFQFERKVYWDVDIHKGLPFVEIPCPSCLPKPKSSEFQ